MSAVTTLPQALRFLVIDASCIQAFGMKVTDYRLRIAMDLVSLQFVEVRSSGCDVHTGETLKHFTLAQARWP